MHINEIFSSIKGSIPSVTFRCKQRYKFLAKDNIGSVERKTESTLGWWYFLAICFRINFIAYFSETIPFLKSFYLPYIEYGAQWKWKSSVWFKKKTAVLNKFNCADCLKTLHYSWPRCCEKEQFDQVCFHQFVLCQKKGRRRFDIVTIWNPQL